MMGRKGQVASADALRVFISSRMEELAAERAVIREALAKLGCAPWLFEVDAGARPGSPRDTYLEVLHTCDVYLGVFWKSRGAYTVDEFDAARRDGLACLVYEKPADDRDAELASFLEEIGHVEEGVTILRFDTAEELGELVIADIEAIQDELLRVRGSGGGTYTSSPCGGRFDRTARVTPIRRHPLHVTDGPDPPDPFVDRHQSVASLQEAVVSAERLLGVTGDPGFGKSAVLRYLAHHPGAGTDAFPDGVGVYVEGGRWPRAGDLLRAVWVELYRVADRDYVPNDVELRADLEAKRALVFVDEVRLRPDEVERVHADVPDSTFVFAAPGEAGSFDYVKSIPLQGFDEAADMLTLFSACCGQPVPDELADSVVQVCRRAGASPGAITRLACDAWGSGRPLSEWLASQSEPDPVIAILERALDPDGRRLLAMLAAFGSDVATPAEVVQRLGVADERVRELVGAGHAYENSPDLRLAGGDYAAIRSIVDVEEFQSLVFDAAVQWVGEAGPGRIRQARAFLLQMLDWGVEQRRAREVMTLARALAPHLAVAGAWESWGVATAHARTAAVTLGDRTGEAWALHEEGTRQMMLGNERRARRLLRHARRLRRSLGERGAVAVTSHNLSHLRVLPVTSRAFWMVTAAVVTTVAVVIGVNVIETTPSSTPGMVEFGEVAVGTTEVRHWIFTNPDQRVASRRVEIAGDRAFCIVTADGTVCGSTSQVVPGRRPGLTAPAPMCDVEAIDARAGSVDVRVEPRSDCALYLLFTPEIEGEQPTQTFQADLIIDGQTQVVALHGVGFRPDAPPTEPAPTPTPVPPPEAKAPPVAVDDVFEVVEGGVTRVDFLRNDYDPDGGMIEIRQVDQPAFGSVYEDGDTYVYENTEYGVESDRFTYTIADDEGETAVATVTIRVLAGAPPPNEPPVAQDDFADVAEGGTVRIDILANDYDPEGGPIEFSGMEPPRFGTVSEGEDGAWYYQHLEYGVEVDSFTYTIRDDAEATDVATVTIWIAVEEALNTPPDAYDAAVGAGCDEVYITLTGADAESTRLEFSIVVWPTQGDLGGLEPLSATEAGVSYTPVVGEGTYTDRFVFQVFDGQYADEGVITVEGICLR